MSDIPPWPLAWPGGLPRTTARLDDRFKTTLPQAIKNVEGELERFGNDTGKRVTEIVLTSNVGGLGSKMPADPGVAAWFVWDGEQRVFAVDRYKTVAANVQAIYHIISARRTELRHGGLHIVRKTFTGFTALPAPEHWSKTLGIDASATVEQIGIAYRAAAKAAGTDETKLLTVNLARDSAIAERNG